MIRNWILTMDCINLNFVCYVQMYMLFYFKIRASSLKHAPFELKVLFPLGIPSISYVVVLLIFQSLHACVRTFHWEIIYCVF